jgi:hypothetical protein
LGSSSAGRGDGDARGADPVDPTMTGRLLDVDAPEWEAVLRTARYDFHHLPAYVAMCAEQEGARPFALYVSGGGREMLLPLLVRDIPGGGTDVTSPYGYPGPIGAGMEDPDFVRAALSAGLRALRDAGHVSAFIRLHPLINPAVPEGLGTLVTHGDTVSIDLTLPTEALWSQLRHNHRRDITRARRLGYMAREDDAWRHLDAFRHVYRETMERRSAAPFYFFDDAYVEGLRDALGERLHLLVVEDTGEFAAGGEVAAAGLFVETDGLVQYHLSGSREAHRGAQPTKLLVHFAMGWAKDRGDAVLHLGGGVGAADDSLFHFKSGFSPLRHAFSTLRIVLDEKEYARLAAAHGPSLDPDDRRGYFPLYRDG